ncbi:MAG: hypothetical protein A3G18_00355 [Rhodospirillales bacterium RIFCSPLOWO2_12_FULL_58_28]|nr:MAG: hypothetical protein A3H92_02965 [Rhodospirillales bacterium RIFCSPLOWO2_02_FULL_58_16]OHC79916.1 MAG: hypothetical protein A3G18_00355 [Rhodospirillales bacterium RIFCSPLOWO2_12_FULL_58_28]
MNPMSAESKPIQIIPGNPDGRSMGISGRGIGHPRAGASFRPSPMRRQTARLFVTMIARPHAPALNMADASS